MFAPLTMSSYTKQSNTLLSHLSKGNNLDTFLLHLYSEICRPKLLLHFPGLLMVVYSKLLVGERAYTLLQVQPCVSRLTLTTFSAQHHSQDFTT
jgi:hypothetical protein